MIGIPLPAEKGIRNASKCIGRPEEAGEVERLDLIEAPISCHHGLSTVDIGSRRKHVCYDRSK